MALYDYHVDEICEAIQHRGHDVVLKNAMPHPIAGNSGPR